MYTKKITIAVSLLLAYGAQAEVEPNRISFGLLSNVASGDLPDGSSNVDNLDSRNQMSYGIGIGLEHDVATGMGIRSGLSILNRQQTWASSSASLTRSQWRARIPVQTQINITEILTLGAGPYVSFPIAAASTAVNVGDISPESLSSTNSEAEIGALASARIDVPVNNNGRLFLEAKYLKGVTDLAREDNTRTMSNDFSSMLGYAVTL